MKEVEVALRTIAMIRHVEWHGHRVPIKDLHGARYAVFAYHLTKAWRAGHYAALDGIQPEALIRCACGVYHAPPLYADRACCPETRNPQLDRIIRETRLAGGEGA